MMSEQADYCFGRWPALKIRHRWPRFTPMHKCTNAQKHKCTKAQMHKCILYLKKKQTTGAKAGENFIWIQLTNQELSVCVKRAGIKSTCYRTSKKERLLALVSRNHKQICFIFSYDVFESTNLVFSRGEDNLIKKFFFAVNFTVDKDASLSPLTLIIIVSTTATCWFCQWCHLSHQSQCLNQHHHHHHQVQLVAFGGCFCVCLPALHQQQAPSQ